MTSMIKENIDPADSNVNGLSKAVLAQRQRREREKLAKHAQHEQQKCERRQNSQRLRRELEKSVDSIEPRHRKLCRRADIVENEDEMVALPFNVCESININEAAGSRPKCLMVEHPSCMANKSDTLPMNICRPNDVINVLPNALIQPLSQVRCGLDPTQ
ncbi:hypothetical protein Dimus_012438, partial [Dionaea muscipula]